MKLKIKLHSESKLSNIRSEYMLIPLGHNGEYLVEVQCNNALEVASQYKEMGVLLVGDETLIPICETMVFEDLVNQFRNIYNVAAAHKPEKHLERLTTYALCLGFSIERVYEAQKVGAATSCYRDNRYVASRLRGGFAPMMGVRE
jgi:hypothetical protein